MNIRTAQLSLLPFLLFIALFLGTGLYMQSQGVEHAFEQLPGEVAIIPALILAVLLYRKPLNESIAMLVKGAGNSNIITMCMIFLLAGAFSSVAAATGGVDAVVNAGLKLIPSGFVVPGLFIIASIISLAMGTSVGTIAALAPIAVGFAEQTDAAPALLAGSLFGGAMFGDNLSVISDTTIAATRTQGVAMQAKFFENIKPALPAAIVTIGLLIFLSEGDAPVEAAEIQWMAAIPYLVILVLALARVDVFAVLIIGTILAGAQGVLAGTYELSSFGGDIASGFASMQGIFLLAMFVGALAEFIKQQGGLHWIAGGISGLADRASGSENRAQQLAIGALVFITDICIANNTVAIVVTGDVSRAIAEKNGISGKRTASILDTFSCIGQGLIPYGHQALLLSATFAITPWEAVIYNYYGMILLIAVLIFIAFSKDRVSS